MTHVIVPWMSREFRLFPPTFQDFKISCNPVQKNAPETHPMQWITDSHTVTQLFPTHPPKWCVTLATTCHQHHIMTPVLSSSWKSIQASPLNTAEMLEVTFCPGTVKYASQMLFTLCTSCSAVYCHRSCLWVDGCVCGSVITITWNCMHRSSPNWVCM